MSTSLHGLSLQIAQQLQADLGYSVGWLGYSVDWWEDRGTGTITFKVSAGDFIYSHIVSSLALHTQRADVIYTEMLACFNDRIKNERPAPVKPTVTASATAVVLRIPDDLDAPDAWI